MKKIGIAALVVAAVFLGSVAYAAIPDSSGVIHGCYLTTGPPQARGALRVIDTEAGQICASGEIALTWNQAGPQGPQGPTGPEGPAWTVSPETVYFAGGNRELAPGEVGRATATCNNTVQPDGTITGDHAIAGGFTSRKGPFLQPTNLALQDSSPSSQFYFFDGWTVEAQNNGTLDTTLTATAVCLKSS